MSAAVFGISSLRQPSIQILQNAQHSVAGLRYRLGRAEAEIRLRVTVTERLGVDKAPHVVPWVVRHRARRWPRLLAVGLPRAIHIGQLVPQRSAPAIHWRKDFAQGCLYLMLMWYTARVVEDDDACSALAILPHSLRTSACLVR